MNSGCQVGMVLRNCPYSFSLHGYSLIQNLDIVSSEIFMLQSDREVGETSLLIVIGYDIASFSADFYRRFQISDSSVLSVPSTELDAQIGETSRPVEEDLVILNTFAHLFKGVNRLINIRYVSRPQVAISNKSPLVA